MRLAKLPERLSWDFAPGGCWLADLRGVRLALAWAGFPALFAFATFCRKPGGAWLGPRPRKARIPWAPVGAASPPSGPPPSPRLLGSNPEQPRRFRFGFARGFALGPVGLHGHPGLVPNQGGEDALLPCGNLRLSTLTTAQRALLLGRASGGLKGPFLCLGVGQPLWPRYAKIKNQYVAWEASP